MEERLPSAERPRMPEGYGLPATSPDVEKHPWRRAAGALEVARNYWVGSTRADGRPHAMPVWGLWLGDALMFSTGRASQKGRNLTLRPEVVVHLESGDDVVILEGSVEEARDAAVLARYVDAYELKYGIRPDTSAPGDVTYVLRPRVALTWCEQDFVQSATRWEFPSS